jgi:hypothetical protein
MEFNFLERPVGLSSAHGEKMKVAKRNFSDLVILFLLASPLLLRAGFEVKVIKSPADLPEHFCSLGQKGDILLLDGRNYILIGASPRLIVTSSNYPYGNAMGSILSFVPAGKGLASDLNIGAPVLRIKDKTHQVIYSKLEQVQPAAEGAPVEFEVWGPFEDKEGRQARIKTSYVFYPEKGRVDITSTLTNTGKVAFEDLGYSLFFDAYNFYSFNPYNEKKFPGLNFRVYQKKGHSTGWISFNPVGKEETRFPGELGPGEECKLRYVLLTNTSSLSLLENIYQILETTPVKAVVYFKDFDGDSMELVVREALTSSVFYRTILEKPSSSEVLLPPGIYYFQANFFPAVVEELVEVKEGQENSCVLENPPLGTVNVKVKNSEGDYVPGKVTFLGLAPTQSPYFQPDNPVETGRSWERFKNSCFPGKDGLDVTLPVGTYLVYASRGPEYSMDQKVVEVVKEENREQVFVVDHVVATPGLVSLDPHMHTQRSDGSAAIPERIKSAVAEGVEIAVASDHNTVTDYSGALKKLKLESELAVIFGSEVTTPDVIHYNTYPMELRPSEEGNGAINSAADEASPLFQASRQKNPAAILEVNHPRAGSLGYFNNVYLDQGSAATALTSFATDFDLLEVLNGPYFFSSNRVAIEDWFHLLNRGYFFPLVGASDAHGLDGDETGYSRTYVFYDGEKGGRLDRGALIQALKKGRSFATNGPIVEFKVNGRYTSGDLVQANGGTVDIRLEVRSAPWVAVDEVRVFLNGERKMIFPVPASETAATRFEKDITLSLKEDAYICVEVLGKKTLFPVLQRPSRSGLLKDGTLPYALTNPVFVDVDGNAKFDPPFIEKIRVEPEPSGPTKKISRY